MPPYSAATLASGPDYAFFTAPPVGTTVPLRFWVLGDSGDADVNAAAVRDVLLSIYRPLQAQPPAAMQVTFSLDLLLLTTS